MLWFQDISFWNWSFEEYPYKKTIIPWISKICVLNNFLISYIHLKLRFRIYLNEMFLLTCRSWELLRFKLERSFKHKLTSSNSKIVFRHFLESKAFSYSRISYQRCYFQDLFTSISVVAVSLAIIERPNVILKSVFVNI